MNYPLSIPLSINYEIPIKLDFKIETFIYDLLKFIPTQINSLEFTFVNDEFMIQFHKKHLQSASPTDIMTFNLGTEDHPDGDIYICVDDAKRNALHLNHSINYEIKTLIVHGVLHLIGYTDYDEPSKKKMFSEQDRLLDLIHEQQESK